jgi:hypothetical protein
MERRDVQQSLLDEVQHTNHSAVAAIAIIERVDALQLVMSHLNEWIGIEYSIVIDYRSRSRMRSMVTSGC